MFTGVVTVKSSQNHRTNTGSDGNSLVAEIADTADSDGADFGYSDAAATTVLHQCTYQN